jgi:GTP diphosphokinase / guanosine-3',5'-bis(diphosphate) 3'-diphosphatase
MTIAMKAALFAYRAHQYQVRKYTGEPYFLHLTEVAGLAATCLDSRGVAIAYLHDTMEDCGMTHEALVGEFDGIIADGVHMLSDLETGNRAARKKQQAQRLAGAFPYIQTIKVCDIISNTISIKFHDPRFFKVYKEEVGHLLSVLTEANKDLLEIAWEHLGDPKCDPE